MKNIMKFTLVFAMAAVLGACSKNVKKAPGADLKAAEAPTNVAEVAADDASLQDEDATANAQGTAITPVYFALNEYTLSHDAMATLEKNAETIKVKAGAKVRVEGNCDDRGTISYNIALGDKRAKEVKDYYVKLGISADSIETVSYGEEKPVCTDENETCWSKNRRSDTVIK
jgi:Outer membrane protein and related peptidoglycan-associated (lipo)proteins